MPPAVCSYLDAPPVDLYRADWGRSARIRLGFVDLTPSKQAKVA
jgi:hypothetical protein